MNYILSKQLDDGGWAVYYGARETCPRRGMLLRLEIVWRRSEAEHMRRARQFILERGGIPQTRMFTRIWLSLFASGNGMGPRDFRRK